MLTTGPCLLTHLAEKLVELEIFTGVFQQEPELTFLDIVLTRVSRDETLGSSSIFTDFLVGLWMFASVAPRHR